MELSLEFTALVDRFLDQTITREEIERLEVFLRKEEALHYFLELTYIEGTLLDKKTKFTPSQLYAKNTSLSPQEESPKVKPLTLASLVAAALILLGFVFHLLPSSSTSTPPAVAQTTTESSDFAAVSGLVGVTWNSPPPLGYRCTKENAEIHISNGLLELEFASGVIATIEAPAHLHVLSSNSLYLTRGKLVADVPKGAEGFTVHHPGGQVVDLGTEFGTHLHQEKQQASVAVFEGEVKLSTPDQKQSRQIKRHRALTQNLKTKSSQTPFKVISFKQERYIRELPNNEFHWTLPHAPIQKPVILEFDVSELVRKKGEFRAIYKWLEGKDVTICHKMELFHGKSCIFSDVHRGKAGIHRNTKNNIYNFSIPENHHFQQQEKTPWILRMHVSYELRKEANAQNYIPTSSGILLFEDKREIPLTPADFIGTWQYLYKNGLSSRVFTADGIGKIYGHSPKETLHIATGSWTVEDDLLIFSISKGAGVPPIIEKHLLKGGNELLFIDRPYTNAKKVQKVIQNKKQ